MRRLRGFTLIELLVVPRKRDSRRMTSAVDRSMPIGCRFSNGDRRFQAEPRHNGGIIGMFADAHAKWLKEDQTISVIPMGAWQQGTTVVCGSAAPNNVEFGTYWRPTASAP